MFSDTGKECPGIPVSSGLHPTMGGRGKSLCADLADIRPGCPGTFGKTFPTRARARNSSQIDPDGLDGFIKTSSANELKCPSMPGRTSDGTTWPDGFFR